MVIEKRKEASKLNQHRATNGLDEDGYIYNPSHKNLIPKAYKNVVDDAINSALKRFPDTIHSMYIYGSVGRGTPTPYLSDLDISVMTLEAVTHALEHEFIDVSRQVCDRHSIITKLDYDVGQLSEVTSPEQRYEWQYWLVCCSANIWSEDITKQLEPHKPTYELAYGINKDIERRIAATKRTLTAENAKAKATAISKKIIRTCSSIVCQDDQSWHTDIDNCARSFLKFYPQKKAEMAQSIQYAQEGASAQALLAYLNDFGAWVQDEFNRKLQQQAPKLFTNDA